MRAPMLMLMRGVMWLRLNMLMLLMVLMWLVRGMRLVPMLVMRMPRVLPCIRSALHLHHSIKPSR